MFAVIHLQQPSSSDSSDLMTHLGFYQTRRQAEDALQRHLQRMPPDAQLIIRFYG